MEEEKYPCKGCDNLISSYELCDNCSKDHNYFDFDTDDLQVMDMRERGD